MSTRTISIIVALVAAGLTAGAFRHIHKKKAHEAAYLHYENNQLRFRAYRNHQQQLATPPPPHPPAARSPAKTQASIPASASPESYRNQGQATPADALQTLAWACDRSDAQAVAQMIQFDPAARIKAEAYFNNLPETERTRWKSVEEVAASQLTLFVMARPFPNSDVLDLAQFETQGEDRAVFRGVRNDRTQFQKIGGTWKIVLTEELIDQLHQLTTETNTTAKN